MSLRQLFAGLVLVSVVAFTAPAQATGTQSGYTSGRDYDRNGYRDNKHHRKQRDGRHSHTSHGGGNCGIPTTDCRFTQGFWQNRAQNAGGSAQEVWLSIRGLAFYQSGYTHAQILGLSTGGNAYYILAHQFIAAKANSLNGADPSGAPVEALIRADQIFQISTPAQIAALPKSDPLRAEMVRLSTTLDKWNNGLIGTGLCLPPVDPH